MGKRGTSAQPRTQHRPTRQEQWQQQRLARERVLQQQQRQQRLRRVGLIGSGGLIVALLALLIVHGVQQARAGNTHTVIAGTGTYTTAVSGETRDGMSCLGTEGTVEHIHMYLAIYVNGQQVQVPSNTGIVNNGSCFYPLHVHADAGDDNIIHEESPNTNTYTLGAFFDVWGQQLSKTRVMSYTADATHPLTFVTIDGSGHKTTVTGNPLNIAFSNHETIYILYNSPNVTPQQFTKWVAGE